MCIRLQGCTNFFFRWSYRWRCGFLSRSSDDFLMNVGKKSSCVFVIYKIFASKKSQKVYFVYIDELKVLHIKACKAYKENYHYKMTSNTTKYRKISCIDYFIELTFIWTISLVDSRWGCLYYGCSLKKTCCMSN